MSEQVALWVCVVVGGLALLAGAVVLVALAVWYWHERTDGTRAQARIDWTLGEIAMLDRYCAHLPQVVYTLDHVRRMLKDGLDWKPGDFQKEVELVRRGELLEARSEEG